MKQRVVEDNLSKERFAAWGVLKWKLHTKKQVPPWYKERDIWWISLGVNIGTEEAGKGALFTRPVLIVKGFGRYQFWGVPLSTTSKSGMYYHKFFVHGKMSNALLTQLRLLDTRRFISRYGVANTKDFKVIRKKLASFIG